ncbi:hypothetical protein [Petralouisia muris]|nr:hypothetical protein [Petralouisia muris]
MKKLQKRIATVMNTMEAITNICICDCWTINAKVSLQKAPMML